MMQGRHQQLMQGSRGRDPFLAGPQVLRAPGRQAHCCHDGCDMRRLVSLTLWPFKEHFLLSRAVMFCCQTGGAGRAAACSGCSTPEAGCSAP
jgi:hypothetical protein